MMKGVCHLRTGTGSLWPGNGFLEHTIDAMVHTSTEEMFRKMLADCQQAREKEKDFEAMR